MELEVLGGDYGLPSLDPSSLFILTYCKFSDVAIDVKCGFQYTNTKWKFPILVHDGQTIQHDVDKIIKYLREQNLGTDFALTDKQSADVIAYSAMMMEKLSPALKHMMWCDSDVVSSVSRPILNRTVPWPISAWAAYWKKVECHEAVYQDCDGEPENEKMRKSQVYKDAKEVMNYLSAKLGDKDYFFGSTPSSLDAMVFSYLAPLLKAPLATSQLQNHLKACTNLARFINNIVAKYFPITSEEQSELDAKSAEQMKQAANFAEFPHRKRNLIIASVVGAVAMFSYAYLFGLIGGSMKLKGRKKRRNIAAIKRNSRPAE